MSTKVISGYYADGYFIQKGNDLLITSTGTVGSPGVGAIYNATITNHGSISGGPKVGAIGMYGGGLIMNGSPTYTGAEISGLYGLVMKYVAGSVTNYGVIEGVQSKYGYGAGLYLDAGGVVRNGSAGSHAATIKGKMGVSVSGGAGSVSNFGYIGGFGGCGVTLNNGGTVVNGALHDTAATIQDTEGVWIRNADGVVHNYATISAGGLAVYVASGGTLTNGSAGDHAALIQGTEGVTFDGVAVVTNAGTIRATGANYGYGGGGGVELLAGGRLTNGALNNSRALVEGYYGVLARDAATVTNFGTIVGIAGGPAVEFIDSTDVLNVEAGSTFNGAVLGGGGKLDLASGSGTISGLFASGGDVTVSGSMAATTFQDFDTVAVSARATFTDSGLVTIGAGQTVADAGTLDLTATGQDTNAGLIKTTGAGVLTIAGPLFNTGAIAADGGTLVVTGAVTGAGVADIDGGTLDLLSGFSEAVAFTGTTGVLRLAHSTAYAGPVTGLGRSSADALDLGDIAFVGSTEATFSGTTRSGVLTITDGTHTARITLKGDYVGSTFVASSDGHDGTLVVDSTARDAAIAPSVHNPLHKFVEAMAGWGAPAGAGAVQTAAIEPSRAMSLVNPRVMTA